MAQNSPSPGPRLLIFLLVSAVLLGIAGAALAAEKLVAEGSSWDKRTAKIVGGWKIVDRDGSLFLVFDQSFKTKKAPDLKAFLTPQPASGVDKKNIPDGSLRLGLLKSHRGAQELALPAGTSLETFRTLVIHCEKYSKVWGVTALP